MTRNLQRSQAPYNTYNAGSKNHALVLRGLQEYQEIHYIINFFQNTKAKLLKVFKIKTKAPLFLIVANNIWTCAKLNKEVPTVLKLKFSGKSITKKLDFSVQEVPGRELHGQQLFQISEVL